MIRFINAYKVILIYVLILTFKLSFDKSFASSVNKALQDSVTVDSLTFDYYYNEALQHYSKNSEYAIDQIKLATAIALESKDFLQIGNSHWMRAYIYKINGDLRNSFRFFLGARKAFSRGDLPSSLNKIEEHLGTIAMDNGSLKIAKKLYTDRLSTALKLGSLEISNAYFDLGLIHFKLSNIDSAAFYFLQARRKIEPVYTDKDSTYLGQVYFELGNIEYILARDLQLPARLDSARNFYQSTLDLDQSLASRSKVTNNIAKTYYRQDSISTARTWFLRALELKEQFGSSRLMVTTLNSLGELEFYSKNYDLAINYFERSIDNNIGFSNVAQNLNDFKFLIDLNKNTNLLEAYQYLDSINVIKPGLTYHTDVSTLISRYSTTISTGVVLAQNEDQTLISDLYEEDLRIATKEKIRTKTLLLLQYFIIFILIIYLIYRIIKTRFVKRIIAKELREIMRDSEEKYG